MDQPGGGMVVALACSAGGFPALRQILAGLPADFPAPIIIAQHRGDNSAEIMVQLLAARTPLWVKIAHNHEALRPGWVYICPPRSHIEISTQNRIHTWEGDRVNFVRPCCDLLFESIAEIGARGICVILTGCGTDGAFSTRTVHRAGGFVIAQSEASAEYPDMPIAAVDLGKVDLILPLKEIAFALCRLTEPAAAQLTQEAAAGLPKAHPPAKPGPS